MITKALIRYQKGNKYGVRIPIFEYAGSDAEYIEEATLCYTPGNIEGYKVGDVVFVSFENNQLEHPVILGKLYLGPEDEPTNGGYCATLDVINRASLPSNTQIGDIKYIELSDVIKSRLRTEQRIKKLEDQVDQLIHLLNGDDSNS